MNTIVHRSNTAKSASAGAAKPSIYEDVAQSDLSLWKKLVQRVDDPVIARELVHFFDDNPGLASRRPGAAIAARVTVQRSRINYAKGRRLGQQVGIACSLLGAAMRLVVRGAVAGCKALAAMRPVQPVERKEPEAFVPMSTSGLDVTHLDGDEGLRYWRAANDAFAAGAKASV
ncbi:hypothetical protein DBR42_21775 [Pelomonas sp. HMWF004]|nr:hypothetical protein DBR42_21775 [Pelomonas sp. HMWF004]